MWLGPAASLAAALPQSQIYELELWNNSIGDEGAALLVTVASKCSALDILDIRFNDIDDHDGILAVWSDAGKDREDLFTQDDSRDAKDVYDYTSNE